MRQPHLFFTLILLAATASLSAQTTISAVENPASPTATGNGSAVTLVSPAPRIANPSPAPFSRLAFGGGISAMGINMEAAVIANRYMNLRGTGNYFTYSVNNIKINSQNGSAGINVGGNLNFATAGASLDFYPFPNHGWRLSPGGMFYNQNKVTATGIAPAGQSFTLGGQTYYSDTVNPVNATAAVSLNTRKQAFTMTTGWGNMISRKGGHWSFPFEVGAAFTGAPALSMSLTGNACLTQADAAVNGPTCANAGTFQPIQSNLSTQIAKYQKDLNSLPVYPILSFGVGYNFGLRGGHEVR